MVIIPSVTAATICAVSGTEAIEKEDFLAIEEPLEIWVEYGPAGGRVGRTLSITMRTPGADEDLVRGFLLTEGIVRHADEIADIQPTAANRILARLEPTATFDMARLERHFYTTSSCGVCGKTSIEALKTSAVGQFTPLPYQLLNPEVIYALSDRLRAVQSSFEVTGGLHASALFSLEGDLLAVREDVGRHNALDKLIGHYAAVQGLPCVDKILLLSGRASFELIQKAAVAGIPVVCAVGAPSSLAVATAKEFGIVLVGFLRGRRFNVYNGM